MWQLTLVYLLVLEALFVTLAATHVFGWQPPVVVAICSPILAYMTQSRSPVEVSTTGVSLSIVQYSVDVPWSNVESIEPKRTGARLRLREAQFFGRRETSTLSLVGCDLLWRKRNTVLAVQAWLDTHGSPTESGRLP
jgi:hypothetical protein